MKKKIFLLFALLCAVAQGAWADDSWSSASSYELDRKGITDITKYFLHFLHLN